MFMYYVDLGNEWFVLNENKQNICDSLNSLSTATWNCNECLWIVPETFSLLD